MIAQNGQEDTVLPSGIRESMADGKAQYDGEDAVALDLPGRGLAAISIWQEH